ncbi:MAG: FAD-dependent oxidoreductase [Lentisphaerae bacterium]|nr:FAD-dependent oxidoreductase [Lentisphaerota bacterium]
MESHIEAGTSRTMRVVALQELAEDIYELTLGHDGFEFEPGECVVLFGPDGISRPYSVASAPTEAGRLRILFRRMPAGLLTSWLCTRGCGDPIMVSYPFGELRPRPEAVEGEAAPVYIATGLGIAPFLSALRDERVHTPKPICIYGVRRLADVIDHDLLRRRCDLRLALSREFMAGHHHGYVDELVYALDLKPVRHYHVCGLDAMVYAVADWLEEQTVPGEMIHTEVFFTA